MKLLQMHADNYGRLHNFTYTFNEGLNTILEENGWGKTTMSSFLKAMLYGFENGSFNNDGDKERERYKPWQGGNYGGSLDFEVNGKAYRVTRSFGNNASGDTVRIIELPGGNPASLDVENLGEELFHIDAGAFDRSVFIRQNSMLAENSSDGIQARLSSMVSEANASTGYAKAVDDLDHKIRVYERADGRGTVEQIERELTEKVHEREAIQSSVVRQKELYESLFSIDDSIRVTDEETKTETEKHETAVIDIQKRAITAQMIEKLKDAIYTQNARQKEITRELGGSIPEEEQVTQIRELREALKKEDDEAAEEEEKRKQLYADLTVIMARYHNQLPNDLLLEEIQQSENDLKNIEYASQQEDKRFEEIQIPEGYNIVLNASEENPDYADQLKDTVALQDEIRENATKAEIRNNALRAETDSWKSVQKGFEALHATREAAEKKLQEMGMYSPAETEPAIRQLDELKDTQKALQDEAESIFPLVEKEDGEYTAAKKTYNELHEKSTRYRKAIEQNEMYSPEQIDELISNLSRLHDVQTEVLERQNIIDRSALSDEEKEILDGYKGDLPESGSSKAIVERLHTVKEKTEYRKDHTAQLDSEKIKAAELTASIEKIDKEIKELAHPGEEPAKGIGLYLIILGVLAIAGGVAGAYYVRIEFAAAAAVGILLIVIGAILMSNAQKARTAHTAAMTEYNSRLEEKEKEKKETQEKLTAVESEIKSISDDLDSAQKAIDDNQKEVREWISKFGKDESDVSDEVISRIGEKTDQVRTLRKRKDELSENMDFVRSQNEMIQEEQKKIAEIYTKTAGMDINDMTSFLRQGKDEYLKLVDKYNEAAAKEEKFLSSCGFDEDVLNGTDTLLPSEAKKRYVELQKSLEEVDAQRGAIDARYEGLKGMDYDRAAEKLSHGTEEYLAMEEQLNTAVGNELQYLHEASLTEEGVRMPESEAIIKLKEEQAEAEAVFANLFARIQAVLKAVNLDVTEENLLPMLEQAETYYTEYSRYAGQKQEHEDRKAEQHAETVVKQRERDNRLEYLSGIYEDLPVLDRVAQVRSERSEAIHLAETIKGLDSKVQPRNESRDKKRQEIREFVNNYGRVLPDTENRFDQIADRCDEFRKLSEIITSLSEQQDKLGIELQKIPTDCDATERDSSRKLNYLKDRKESLLVERTKTEAAIKEIDKSLVKYPRINRELRELVERKETALTDLRLLRKTLGLMRQARESLASRYYHRVEKLFNDYMRVWLNSNTIKGLVDDEFNISIQEDGKTRSAQGYSAGYCDLIDFCMRMALVDTMFEGEQPFLILDDPFVNLDEERLNGALELLGVVAAQRQIIYFVCHPVRARAASSDPYRKNEFARIAGKTSELRNAMRRESRSYGQDDEYTRPQYVVTGDVVPFVPADPQMVIRDQVFRLAFTLTDEIPPKNASYELFFVNEEGVVVSDRKLLEFNSGELIPDDIRFMMDLPEHTSARVDLVVKREGTDEYEISARFPFRALLTIRS